MQDDQMQTPANGDEQQTAVPPQEEGGTAPQENQPSEGGDAGTQEGGQA